eukprot:1504193-Rhodomonas_salina.3
MVLGCYAHATRCPVLRKDTDRAYLVLCAYALSMPCAASILVADTLSTFRLEPRSPPLTSYAVTAILLCCPRYPPTLYPLSSYAVSAIYLCCVRYPPTLCLLSSMHAMILLNICYHPMQYCTAYLRYHPTLSPLSPCTHPLPSYAPGTLCY